MEAEFGGVLHHLSSGGSAVRVDENGVLRGGRSEYCQIAGLERIQTGAFLSDDFVAQPVAA